MVAVWSGACGSPPANSGDCLTDRDCASDEVCLFARCLPSTEDGGTDAGHGATDDAARVDGGAGEGDASVTDDASIVSDGAPADAFVIVGDAGPPRLDVRVEGGSAEIVSDDLPIACSGTGVVCSTSPAVGSVLELFAVPPPGYDVTWSSEPASLGCNGSSSTCTVSVATPLPASGATVTLTLAPSTHTFTLVSGGVPAGVDLVIVRDGIASPCDVPVGGSRTTCTSEEPHGSVVTVRRPITGIPFYGWSGDCLDVTGDCVVVMDRPRTVTSTVGLLTRSVHVNTSGPSTGTVDATTPTSPVLHCGSACTTAYSAGTMVTLAATPSAGFSFSGWGGSCTGAGTCSVLVSTLTIATAQFERVAHTVTVTRAEASGAFGSVHDASGLHTCPSDCAMSYPEGTEVTLVAEPLGTAHFGGWLGCTRSAGRVCTVAVTADTTVVATFDP